MTTMDMTSGTGEWKGNTPTLAYCMICGSEYPEGTKVCLDCDVSLSVVRRCPKCKRIVSAQHTKCVHCRHPFIGDQPQELVQAEAQTTEFRQPLNERMKQFRAIAVTAVAALFVLCVVLFILRPADDPSRLIRVVARSSVLHATGLRRSPSGGSAVIDKVSPGIALEVTGSQHGEQGLWLGVKWNNAIAYAPAHDLTPPQAIDADSGASVLKVYLTELEASDPIDLAVKSVDYFAQVFPSNPQRDELRWILAERLRSLSASSGSKGPALRRQADEQYEQLTATNGSYAQKSRDALARISPHQDGGSGGAAQTRKTAHKENGLQIVDSGGVHGFTSDSSNFREVMVLTRTEVMVHAGKLSQSNEGAVVSGRVAYDVKANGIVAIPAGSLCQLRVLRSDSTGILSLGLTSIEINHKVYAVKSSSTEMATGNRQKVKGALTFHLDAPLVLER